MSSRHVHIFGPVPSRRLGRSLGVDLVPLKTCTYDCIYCQIGCTTHKVLERQAWAPVEEILAELAGRLDSQPDYITLSGSGEPTLYSRLGELVRHIKSMTDIPLAVLTNGSLLWREDVQADLAGADLVVPSLDAGNAAMFQKVNRPHPELSFQKMLAGLIEFRKVFTHQYWLEVLLVAGYTDVEGEVQDLAECAGRIRPDRVQLNTVTRPPAESFAAGVPRERMAELAKLFTPPAEVIADFREAHKRIGATAGCEEILQMLRRRPCSIDDVAEGLAMHRHEVAKHIEELLAEGLIMPQTTAGKCYYSPKLPG